jgi:hypothetical protein
MEQNFDALQWYNVNGNLQAPGRAGYGKYFQCRGITAGLSLPVSQLTCGFAINFNGQAGALNCSFIDQITDTVQCYWVINPLNGMIQLNGPSGAVLATALNSISQTGFYFIELQIKVAISIGAAAIRVNGQGVASFPDLTGIDTQASSNASVSGVSWSQISPTNWQFDDVYFADGTTGPGSYPNNSFLGDVRSSALFPISDSSVGWTPLANANWQEVSETAMDGDASYNFTATAGARDLFNFGALDIDVNQVLGLQMKIALRKEDAGARTVAPVLYIGGSYYVGTAVSVDVTYLYITTLWPINPHTSASWTAADVNALVAGYVVVT